MFNNFKEKELTGYPSIDRPQDKGYNFFTRHPFVPNTNVYSVVKILNMFNMNKEAVDCLNLHANYKQLFSDAVIVSKALSEIGVKKGEIVAVSMPNYYQAIVLFLACNRIGATVSYLNSFSTQEEQNTYLNEFDSQLLINFAKTDEENKAIKKDTKVKNIITLKDENLNSLSLHDKYVSSDTIDYNSLGHLANNKSLSFKFIDGATTALVLFTSGTTGRPKSVEITNKNILAAGIYQKGTGRSRSLAGDKTLVCVPFVYPFGFVTSALMTLLMRKTAILAPSLSKDTISYYLSKNPNIIFGSPALLELIKKNVPEDQDLSSIMTYISGGDFLTPTANKSGLEFFEKHGAKNVKLGNGSGNAETVSSGTCPVGNKIRPETAGKILAGTDAMIVNEDTMEELKYNEEGMLCVAGEHVFKGYLNNEELTNEVIFNKDGKRFFKTGTRGYIDEDGYFTITGRASRFYILSTLNKVYCDHVQNVISYFDCVEDCTVVQVPDEELLFRNKVYVVLKEGYKPSDELISYIRELCNHPITTSNGETLQLKEYEIPSYIEFVSSLPRKEGTEKINYMLLEEDAKQKGENNINIRLENKIGDLPKKKVLAPKHK